MKIYTYKNCSTCRKAVAHLKNSGQEFEEIPIRDIPPTVEELKRMLKSLDGDVKALFNRSGQDYRALNLKDKLPDMSEAEAHDLVVSGTSLAEVGGEKRSIPCIYSNVDDVVFSPFPPKKGQLLF